MSRRREAAELAHALALSTQQARDISDISPHSLSSENPDRTQDSKELELRIVGMEPPIGTGSDEVAFFSSRNVDGDATHDDTIQSFSASHHDNPVHLSSSDPFHVGAHQADHGTHLISGQPYSPALAHLSATGQTPGSCSIRPKLSPTQTSDAQARPVVTYQRKRDTERTPLKRKDTNKDFQLSSSPPSADDRHLSDEHKLPNNPSSEPEIIEIIGSDRIRGDPGSSSSRGRLLPEIVLSSKKRSITRQESPDPLDSFAGIDRHQADDRSVPQIVSSSISSSAGPSNSPLIEQEDNGRRSGRVKAATEKKEAEKEERRRLRRERKAREEEEKRRGEARGRVSDQVSSSRRATPRKRQETVEDDVRSGDTPHSTNSIIATPATANKKTPVPKRMKPSAKKRSQKSTNDDQNLGVVTTSNPPRTNVDENTTTITMSEVQNDGALDHESDEIIISDAPLAKELSATTSGVVVETAPVVSPVEESIKALSHEAPTAPVSNAIEGSSNSHSEASSVRARTPLSPPARHSPGPQGPSGSSSRPGGIKWQTSRTDLNSVLSKFPGSRMAGMSKRHRIAPLHAKIGPPVKALPPVPLKPVRKKKDDEDEDDEDEEGDEGGSGDEEGRQKKNKAKAMEWLMMED